MTQKLIAGLLAVFFLGLAGLMASVTIFVRDPMPVLSMRAPLLVPAGEAAAGDGLRATLSVDPTYAFEIIGQAPGGGVPEISLRRGEGDGAAVAVEVESAGDGMFLGRGQFTAPGRWTLTVATPAEQREVAFILQE